MKPSICRCKTRDGRYGFWFLSGESIPEECRLNGRVNRFETWECAMDALGQFYSCGWIRKHEQ